MLGRTLLTTATVVVLAFILSIPVPAVDRPESPDDEDDSAAITSYLHTVSPSVISAGDQLRLAGVVENTGDEPLTNVQALPRWSNVQLETRDEIRRVGGDPSVRWGFRRDDPYEVVDERLEPGETQEFELVIDDAGQMGLGLAGVYAVGVDIRGTLSNGERSTLDTSRTVVPWMPDGDAPPTVQVSLLWPVEAPPSLLPDGTLFGDDEALASRFAEGGALDAIIDAGSSSPVTWLVDPDVLDTVDALADDDDAASASAWRSAFDEATGGAGTFLLPYARPDVDAMLRTDRELAAELTSTAVDTSRAAARGMDGARTGVARPDGGTSNEDVLSLLAETGVRTVILSAAGVSPLTAHPLAQLGTAEGELDVVLTDPGLDTAIADAYTATHPDAGALDLRQRWAAETAMVALEAQARGQQPAPLVAAPPTRWTPDSDLTSVVMEAWTSLPWVSPTVATDLDAPAPPVTVTATPDENTGVLQPENIESTRELRAAAHDYTALLAESEPGLSDDLERATLRSASTGWREDPAAGVEYASEITEELDDQLDEVHVSVPETVTLSSRTGVFPLTVTNDLDQPVNVGLMFQAANPDRLKVDDVAQQRVAAGTRETIDVRAEAVTNGRVPITVQLTTNDGVPLGPATETVVHATDYGTIGWFIIAGATALFGASLIRTTLRRRRKPADDAAAEATNDDGSALIEPTQDDAVPAHPSEVRP